MTEDTFDTTIQDVVGCRPFDEPSAKNFTYLRATMSTWLRRNGWSSETIAKMSQTEITDCYVKSEAAAALALKYGQPVISFEQARRTASARYVPKDKSVLRMLKFRGNRQPTVPLAAPTPAIDMAEIAKMVKAELERQRPAEVIVKIMSADKVTAVKGVAHPKLPIIAKAMASRMTNGFHPNIWLGGQTGSGKSHVVEQIANAMGLKFYVHGALAMSHELLGYCDANGEYHPTPFRTAFEKGGVVLLDECDSWDPAVTLALNGMLANGVAAFPDGMVKRHKDSIFVAAGNTFGAGATSEFVGRNKLDAAFMSRFPVKVQIERDPRIEIAIAGGNEVWVRRVMAARARAAAAGMKHLIDPRHSQAGAALIAAGMTMDEAAELTYLAGLPDAQRRTIEGV